jgi:ATP-binding protein involved in chromosome partitioning
MPLKMYQKNPSSPLAEIRFVVAVAAGKGGVGKSTVAVHLALSLKAKGFEVGIMDADIYGPSIRKMLPEDRLPTQRNGRIIPAVCAGIKMISMAYFRKDHEAAVIRAPIANGFISQFIKNVEWGHLDFLILDFPPGTGDVQLTLSQQSNLTGAVMVTTPQEMALLDVRKAMNMFNQVKVPIIGIIENMSYYLHPQLAEPVHIFGRGGGERLAREFGVPFLGHIPIDSELCQLADEGRSLLVIDLEQKKLVTQAFLKAAQHLIDHVNLLNTQQLSHLQSFELVWKEMEIS